MSINKTEQEKVMSFLGACNDFLTSKFILSDVKIARILKTVADSEQLYNLLSECLINFNYEEEFNRCLFNKNNDDNFVLPVEYYKLIPLVFTLLVNIDSAKINLNDFLSEHFNGTNQSEQYRQFGQNIILPFKNAVTELFAVESTGDEMVVATSKTTLYENENHELHEVTETQVETVDVKEENDYQKFFEEVKANSHYLLDKLVLVKKRARQENIRLILNAIIRSCEIKEMTVLSALFCSLTEIARKEKALLYGIDKIINCYNEYLLNDSD